MTVSPIRWGTTLVGVFSRSLHVFFGFGPCCRFYPSCSQYTQTAIRIHGWVVGSGLSLRRLFRCRPGVPGGLDPVPPRKSNNDSDPIGGCG